MGAKCCPPERPASDYARRLLWVALAINGGLFVTEIVAGAIARSVSLQADALDF